MKSISFVPKNVLGRGGCGGVGSYTEQLGYRGPPQWRIQDFPWGGGGADLVGGCQLPRQLCFEKFVCQNKRIWTLGGHAPVAPPWICQCTITNCNFYNVVITVLPAGLSKKKKKKKKKNRKIPHFQGKNHNFSKNKKHFLTLLLILKGYFVYLYHTKYSLLTCL